VHRISGLAGLTIVCAAALTLLSGGPSQADPHDDKNRVDQQLATTQATLEAATDRAQQAATTYASVTAALPAAEAALADARGRALGAQAAAREADREAARTREAAAGADQAFNAAATKVEEARAAVSGFVSAAYRGSGFLMVNSILESGSPTDFANRMGYLDSVAGEQQRALGVLTAARMEAKQESDVAEAARTRAAEAAENAKASLRAALAAESTAEQAANTLHGLADQQAQAMAVAEQERAATLARYNELREESDRITAELRAVAAREAAAARAAAGRNKNGAPAPGGGQVPAPRPGAYFAMPVNGWKSSNFGMRYDPYYKVWQLHAGVDLAAGGGQPIGAAADGVVVRTGWAGGYGNYTCVSHGEYQGKGIATCYGHQSQILVSPGQRVRRGQVIGRVGETGAATGYHLHFEVRLDGTPVDPLGWLPSCLC
jgi:murein DD-endopeptidase MepM/ murein hydrolase activator NlpD